MDNAAEEEAPDITSLEWTRFVMKQFDPDELFDAYPTCDALRRVAEKMLGPIISSESRVVQPPSSANGFHATVEHNVKFMWTRTETGQSAYVASFTDVADCCPLNCADPFWQHAAAVAATRAEGRALRKALRLRRVYAAEEVGDALMGEKNPSLDGRMVAPSQLNFFDMMATRLNINVLKLINAGEKTYAHAGELPYGKAIEIFHYLNQIQTGSRQVPDALVGYEPGWKERFVKK
jgi:hypothetical protein